MQKFNLELKAGNTIEEMMSIFPERQKELASLIKSSMESVLPQTTPDMFQIVCGHCQNLNELVYYIFCVGENFGLDQAMKGGYMSLGLGSNGNFTFSGKLQ